MMIITWIHSFDRVHVNKVDNLKGTLVFLFTNEAERNLVR